MNKTKLVKVSRRKFLKTTGAAASVPFVAGSIITKSTKAEPSRAADLEEKIIETCSTFDCGGKCDIRTHVQGGKLVRISTIPDDEVVSEMPLMRACVRGRAYRKFINHPNRLKYPMKRVGKRGEGKFERISWDEATSIIAEKMQNITKEYGPESRHVVDGTGVISGMFNGTIMAKRLCNLTGGYLSSYGNPSMINAFVGTQFTFGDNPCVGSSLDTLFDSKLIILWGHNPAETIFDNTNHFLQQLKRNGTRIVVVDPRFSDSTSAYADQWVPIRPASDSAMIEAMMYVIYTEGLYNKEFVDKYTLGITEESLPEGIPSGESLISYLLGGKDGIKKTPEWAEAITGVEASVIRSLAIEYATARPAALIQGWGPSRHVRGEHVTRSTAQLPALTGNIGVSGGWAGAYYAPIFSRAPVHPHIFENPVKKQISFTNWVEAIESPEKVTPKNGLIGGEKLTTPVKMLFVQASNYLVNQTQNANYAAEVLEDESKCEFIIVSDLYMTPSAKYADILLPETSFAERWNLAWAWGYADYVKVSKPIVKAEFERRSDYEWLSDVAHKLGVGKKFTEGRSEEDWIKHLWEEYRTVYSEEDLPNWKTMVDKGTHLFRKSSQIVAFKEQIEDPENNPFPTKSGKIEIFSEELFNRKDDEIPALSHYQPSPESFADTELIKSYPLQLITWKPANRANSTQYDNPWLKEVKQQELWINPIDARKRQIENGTEVRVFNKRGIVQIKAKVTPRIIPGVVGLANGAWRNLDSNKVDHGGCADTLSCDLKTPIGKGNAHKTMLVQVKIA
ncbi:molybdopterin-dependent oxidoreductase [Vibrio parahaemolyticus]|nr:molybdopterin-dependent oxidoreductase [Vibrio parahaemolyticus]EIT7131659.1 molybdopterin-dependent oxidoreductase [Vibrio parahaemolyticus]